MYADPPYVGSAGQYAEAPFEWADFVRLLEWLDGHDGPVVVSQRAAAEVVEALSARGYEVSEVVGPSDHVRFGRGEVVGWRCSRFARVGAPG